MNVQTPQVGNNTANPSLSQNQQNQQQPNINQTAVSPQMQPVLGIQNEAMALKQAQQAISQYQTQMNQQNSENESLKRRHADMSSALAPFGGATGLVNASQDNGTFDHGPKRAHTDDPSEQQRRMINEVSKISNAKISDRMLHFRAENPKATWKDYDMMYRSSRDAMGAQSTLMGMVNASNKSSARPTWSKQDLDVPIEMPDLNAQHLQPQLFAAIQEMITGRTIGPDRTRAMMNGINVGKDPRYA